MIFYSILFDSDSRFCLFTKSDVEGIVGLTELGPITWVQAWPGFNAVETTIWE